MHRGGERRRGGGFRRRVLEMHAELVEHVLGVGEHVHQVRDRRALIAADIGDAGLQQRLGDRENALAAELLAVAQLRDPATSRANERSAMMRLRGSKPSLERSRQIVIYMKPSDMSCNGVGGADGRIALQT